MPRYPDAETALSPVRTEGEAREAVMSWKRSVWKAARRRGKDERRAAVLGLVRGLSRALGRPCRAVPCHGSLGKGLYLPRYRTVMLSGDSIVTALHETAHHLFGPDEETAVRWSVSLFRECFPKAFRELETEGHMLVRKRRP